MLQYLYLQANNIADMNKSVIEKFLQYLLIERRFPKNTVVAYRNDLMQLQEFYNSEKLFFRVFSYVILEDRKFSN